MYSFLFKCASFNKVYLNVRPKNVDFVRSIFSEVPEQNIRKYKLIKRLASTILFGGTFLIAVWLRKHKKPSVFDRAKLVKAANYGKSLKLYELDGFVFPSFVMKNIDSVRSFQCREDDIFVVSFPKTGTTWLQEIIYCIMNGIEKASSTNIEERFPYLEFVYPGLSAIEKYTGQRFLKTHLPYTFLPEDIQTKKPKIFYIMRNPKDVSVSYYHFVRMLTISEYSGTFEDFFQDFISDIVPYGPLYKHYGDMWEHKEDPNVIFLYYEELHKDVHSNIKKIAEFLGKSLSDQEVDEIAEHCSFQNMSTNPNVNYQHWDSLGIRKKGEARFFRKGKIGDWKQYMNEEMNNSIELWIEKHMNKFSQLFQYEDCNKE